MTVVSWGHRGKKTGTIRVEVGVAGEKGFRSSFSSREGAGTQYLSMLPWTRNGADDGKAG